MIRNVPEARKRILAVLIVLLLLDVAAVALLLSPIGRSRTARQDEYERVRQQLLAKRRDSLPARDMDKKLANARKQIDEFYRDRLPARYSEVSEQIGKIAGQNKVQVASIKYDAKDSDIPGLQNVQIDATLSGDYANEMRFINALERNKLLFVLDNIELGETQGGGVRLQLRFETYMRTAA